MSRTSEEILNDYTKVSPRVLDFYDTPDAEERKKAFLAGKARHPGHAYVELHAADFHGARQRILALIDELPRATDATELLLSVYRQYMERGLADLRMLAAAKHFNVVAESGFLGTLAGNDYLLAGSHKGTSVPQVYHGIVNDLRYMRGVNLPSKHHREVYEELLCMLPTPVDSSLSAHINISPATEQWVTSFVEVFYENLLNHVPDQPWFTPAEIVQWFTVILRRAFGSAAKDWRVVLGKCSSVKVSARQKLVIVSPHRAAADHKKMRQLVVHELGVHLLRAVTGSSSDVPVLGWGMPGYFDAEEGLAVVFEECMSGEHKVRGVPLYLSACLARIEGYDFREVYERMWRFSYVTDNTDSVEKAQSVGYNRTRRIFRGTDRLPYLSDLVYYNGYVKVWRMLELFAGNIEGLLLLLLGKFDLSNDTHRRVVLESSSL